MSTIREPVKPAIYDLFQTFGLPGTEGKKVQGAELSLNPDIPSISPGYRFRRDKLRELVTFLAQPEGDALFIWGPSGSGKSSLVGEVCGRLNWPLVEVTCHQRLEPADLIGMYKLMSEAPGQPPVMTFAYGPLALAMQYGFVLLINEWDYGDPGSLGVLNEVLQGKPLMIVETGEVIYPHPMFRIVATGNSCGNGDESGLFAGILQQNAATMDRFRFSEIGYMPEDDEMDLVCNLFPKIPKPLVKRYVKAANAVRERYLAIGSPDKPALTVTMSTRTLLRWCRLSRDNREHPTAIRYALEMALLHRCRPSDRLAVEQIVSGIFTPEQWHGKQANP